MSLDNKKNISSTKLFVNNIPFKECSPIDDKNKMSSKSSNSLVREDKTKTNKKLNYDAQDNIKLIKSNSPRKDKLIKDNFKFVDKIDYKKCKFYELI